MASSASFGPLCFSFSLLLAACSSSDSQGGTVVQGAGGGIAAGGASTAGGAPSGSGGIATGSGGAAIPSSGGALASGGAAASGGAGAVGGAGGETDGGTSPEGGTVPSGPCRDNSDCAATAGKPLCEAASGTCISCHTNAQCSAKQECVNKVCTDLPKCQNSLDCASASDGKTICDQTNGVCVQCTANPDCGSGKACNQRVCRTQCSSDNDCTGQHMLCNKGIGFNGQCTECLVAADCDDGRYCEAGACVNQVCKPAQQSCDDNVVVQCNETGSGVTPLTQCTLVLLSSCKEDGDNARCVGACENGKKDTLETDVDCGGATCPRCTAGKACVLPTDCTSNKCTSSKCE